MSKIEKEKFEAFQKVLVRDNEVEEWSVDFFSHYRKDDKLFFVTTGGIWNYCIPYENNEHLVGTTNMPTEKNKTEKRWRAKEGKRFYYANQLGEAVWEEERCGLYCDKLYTIGNYFRTKKEAEEMAKRIMKLLKTE